MCVLRARDFHRQSFRAIGVSMSVIVHSQFTFGISRPLPLPGFSEMRDLNLCLRRRSALGWKS